MVKQQLTLTLQAGAGMYLLPFQIHSTIFISILEVNEDPRYRGMWIVQQAKDIVKTRPTDPIMMIILEHESVDTRLRTRFGHCLL